MVPIVFDLDGTLVDSLPSIRDAVNATLAEVEILPLEDPVVAGFVGRGERVLVARLLTEVGLSEDQFDDILSRFMRHYAVTSKAVRLFPGVKEALSSLRAAGHPTALCTNKPGVPTRVVLDVTGLDRLLDFSVAGDALPKRKPDPEPLLHILKHFGAVRAVYVGDNGVDAETAARAGQPFVLYSEGIRIEATSDIDAAATFSDYAELPGIIRRLT